ncbi:MAG: hypothetical protein MH204_08440 [Fimbriimonadaceae bacterium]|nr:hypothetical protein [Fimbriimonadaceae bacterium]
MRRLLTALTTAALLAGTALAQPATEAQRAGVTPQPGFGTLHLEAALGSFRLIDGQGRVQVSFEGTVLVSQVQGTVTATGAVRKEFEDAGRAVYHGRGTIVVVGKWRAIQWFGGNMRAVWYGTGLARITGEFDRNQNSGAYWYDNPARRQPWFPNSTITITNPQAQRGNTGVQPRRRPRGGGN